MRIAVCGAAGFIGSFVAKRLISLGHSVYCIDKRERNFDAQNWITADLEDPNQCKNIFHSGFDQVYQFAADMGGAEYIFTGANDFQIMSKSTLININILQSLSSSITGKILFASTACVYPQAHQESLSESSLPEDCVYPADPDSEYGWQKLFSERLFLAFARSHATRVHIARYHNVYGPGGTWTGGREKVPAALCRKVIMAPDGDSIEVFGNGRQTRSFLYIDDCVEASLRLMNSTYYRPINIGSEESITINGLAELLIEISGKNLSINNITGPLGVRHRRSDNALASSVLDWKPTTSLQDGMRETYAWISTQVARCQ